MNRQTWMPFFQTTLVWEGIAGVGCAVFGSAELVVFLILSFLAIGDLVSTSLFFAGIFEYLRQVERNDKNPLIRAFYWGMVKLGCVTLLVFGFIKRTPRFGSLDSVYKLLGESDSYLNRPGVLAGMATFVVIPLAGGLLWHRRTNQDSH